MNNLRYVIASVVIALFLAVASDFVGENKRYKACLRAADKIERIYDRLQTRAPDEAAQLDQALKTNTEHSVEQIIKDPQILDAKAVVTLSEFGIRVDYVHEVRTETIGYFKDHFLRFVLFLVLTGGISFLVNRMSLLSRKVIAARYCPIPDASIRQQITVTLAEVLAGEPDLARQLTSPNESFVDRQVLQSIKSFCNGTARSGLVLVRSNCEYREYADIALMLDEGAKQSIYSTNVGGPENLFRTYKTEVTQHLKKVNEKARGPQGKTGVYVKRYQIHLSDTDKEQFETFLVGGSQEAIDYNTYYKNVQNVDFKQLIVGPELGWPEFLGDYIVYNDRIILKFDEDTKTLMLLVGQEVIAQHIAVFSKEDV